MMINRTLFGSAVALLLGLAPAAQAADFCLYLAGPTVVGKGFRVPPPGRCKPFMGFAMNAGGPNTVTGSACTASDNSHVDFALTSLSLDSASPSPTPVGFDAVRITLPVSIGTGTDIYSNSNGLFGVYSANVAKCPASVVPLP